jgi:hypothetical protein
VSLVKAGYDAQRHPARQRNRQADFPRSPPFGKGGGGILKMTSWKACGWTDRSDLEALGTRSFRGSEYDASICLKLRARTTMRSPKQIGGLKRYWLSAEDYYREKIRHARANLTSFQF